MRNIITICEHHVELVGQPNDRSWGKGIDISFILDKVTVKVSFICHPEFKDFNLYNDKNHIELFNEACTKLAQTKDFQPIKLASQNGIAILRRFNGAT